MNGIEIITKDEQVRKEKKRSILSLVFLLSGVFGILFFFYALEGPKVQKATVNAIAAAYCIVLWYIYSYRYRFFHWFSVVSVLLCALFIEQNQESLLRQFYQIGDVIFGFPIGEPIFVTAAVTVSILGVCILLFFWSL